MPINENKRVKLLGSHVDCLTMDETLERIKLIIQKRESVQHVVINASKINLMHKNKRLQEIVNASPLVNADGQSIVWAGRFFGYDIPERVTGIDLFTRLVSEGETEGYKVYYFGAEEEVVKQVVAIHQEMYPKLKIAGYRNGYFEDKESLEIVQEINKSGADIVFVAFSSPKKEFWIHEYIDQLNVPFVMGVGGSFDVISGKTKRAPNWMKNCGLEWLFRFAQEPIRLFKRYFIGNLSFVFKVLLYKFYIKEQ